MRKRKRAAFEELTWDDLEEWAGTKIVSRGKSYLNAMNDLRRTPDGKLVAWVSGTHRYATLAKMDESGQLSSNCTCPYSWGPCKHAVAVILAYLEAVKKKQNVPVTSPNDERLLKTSEEEPLDPFDEWDDDEDNWDDDEEEFGKDDLEEVKIPTESRKRRRASEQSRDLREYLAGMSKDALVDFISDLAHRHEEVHETISDKMRLERGSTGRIVASIRQEIEELSSRPAWTNHWSGEGEIPDYSRVRERMEALLRAGQADGVVALGLDLLRLGIRQVEQSHDEGETGSEIGQCMEIVFRAIPKSSLLKVDQILWMIDAFLEDDYSILDSVGDNLHSGLYGQSDWSTVADRLGERLAKIPCPGDTEKKPSFSWTYKRQTIMRWTIRALDNAGRKQEVIPLLEREAPITGCYKELVDRLISIRRRKEARIWAKEGFERSIGKWDGIAWSLEGNLRDLAEREENWPLLAAYRALEFLEHREISKYTVLEKAAKRAKVWPEVRNAVLHFLETGVRPDRQPGTTQKDHERGTSTAKKMGSTRTLSSLVSWPLPPTEIELPPKKDIGENYPDIGMLINIAIDEKRPNEVLKWFEVSKKRGHGGRWNHDKVAVALQETHPDVSLELWKGLAEAEIAHVQPAAYQEAGRYLKKMQTVYQREKRLSEWQAYLTKLREDNSRRPRMVEVLDRLESKQRRILDKR